MAIELKRYAAVIVENPGGLDERTRDETEIMAANDSDAVQKAEEWAGGRALDGDVLQVVENGRGVQTIPLRVLS